MRHVTRLWLCVALGLVLTLLSPEARASHVKYGKWYKDEKKDRYYCKYTYPDRTDSSHTNAQICLYYPHDKAKSDYYYFASEKGKIWGRCVCPKSSHYDADHMQWSKYSDGEWHNLKKGDCPAPADGDQDQGVIDKIPDPPGD